MGESKNVDSQSIGSIQHQSIQTKHDNLIIQVINQMQEHNCNPAPTMTSMANENDDTEIETVTVHMQSS